MEREQRFAADHSRNDSRIAAHASRSRMLAERGQNGAGSRLHPLAQTGEKGDQLPVFDLSEELTPPMKTTRPHS